MAEEETTNAGGIVRAAAYLVFQIFAAKRAVGVYGGGRDIGGHRAQHGSRIESVISPPLK